MTALSGVSAFITDPELLGPWFSGESWSNWLTVLKGAFGEVLSESEHRQFVLLAEREPPRARVRELWALIGRRAGKDSTASAIATYMATAIDWGPFLRPGERSTILCLACDREQASLVFSYIAGYFEQIPMLGALVRRKTVDTLELEHVDITVATCSYRAIRGKTVALAILDEVGFWRPEGSAFVSPDTEVYSALLPALSTLRQAGAMIVAISSVYRRSGLLYSKWKDHHGTDGDVLVIRQPSIVFNPTLDQADIDADMALDPARGAAEWLSEWRTDISDYIDRAVVEALVVPGRVELARRDGAQYMAFVDASGGSGSDSMALAVAHVEGAAVDRRVLDCIREWRPPFSPDQVTAESAMVLRDYGITSCRGDRYGGDWVSEKFLEHGISYEPAEKFKRDLYVELLPILNSGRAELLDNPRLVNQICALERRSARGSRDTIDHPVNGHDDLANVCAGSLTLAGIERSLLAWRGML
jgi:hypothetical protein